MKPSFRHFNRSRNRTPCRTSDHTRDRSRPAWISLSRLSPIRSGRAPVGRARVRQASPTRPGPSIPIGDREMERDEPSPVRMTVDAADRPGRDRTNQPGPVIMAVTAWARWRQDRANEPRTVASSPKDRANEPRAAESSPKDRANEPRFESLANAWPTVGLTNHTNEATVMQTAQAVTIDAPPGRGRLAPGGPKSRRTKPAAARGRGERGRGLQITRVLTIGGLAQHPPTRLPQRAGKRFGMMIRMENLV